MDKKIFNVASYNRKETLLKTIESIYNQADIINVALNNYDEIPPELYDKKINLFITNNEKGDAYKFINLKNSNGYFFTIDDDLLYPENYADFMIHKIEKYQRKNIVTLHGRNFKNFPIRSYYDGKNTSVFHFANSLNEDTKIQFGGTGVMAFHTNLFKIDIDYFKYPNMADVWIGKFAKENDITITCVNHKGTFVKQQEFKESIYSSDLKNDTLQTMLVNQAYSKKDLSVIIPTFKNTEYIDECLNSIINTSKEYNIEILVGIDDCKDSLNHILNSKYPNYVKFYYFLKNEGPYLIKNTLSKISNSDFILFFDSDDVATENMIPTIIVNKNNYQLIRIKFKNFGGKSPDGKDTAFGEGVFAIKKDEFLSMNGFEPWMCAADSDFMGRYYKKHKSPILHTKDIMFNRRIHNKGLTSKKETGLASQLRKSYVKISEEKKYEMDPKFLNIREFKQIMVTNLNETPKELISLMEERKKDIEKIEEELLRKKDVLNTIKNLNLKIRDERVIDYNRINTINNKGVYNPSQHKKDPIVTKPKEKPIIPKEDSLTKLKQEMFPSKPNRRNNLPNVFGNKQRRKGGFSI